MVPVEQEVEERLMTYVRTGSSFDGMGTVGGAASTGASAGGQSGGSSSSMDIATSAVGAAVSIAGSVVDAYYAIQGMRSERQTLATGSNLTTAQLLEENHYRQQAQQMLAEEISAQNAADSATGAALRRQEDEIVRETARLRQEQTQRDVESRIGGQFGQSRALPSWAWWGIGIGGVGVTFLVIWLVARQK